METIVCSRCKYETPTPARFCMNCGQPLQAAPLPPADRATRKLEPEPAPPTTEEPPVPVIPTPPPPDDLTTGKLEAESPAPTPDTASRKLEPEPDAKVAPTSQPQAPQPETDSSGKKPDWLTQLYRELAEVKKEEQPAPTDKATKILEPLKIEPAPTVVEAPAVPVRSAPPVASKLPVSAPPAAGVPAVAAAAPKAAPPPKLVPLETPLREHRRRPQNHPPGVP